MGDLYCAECARKGEELRREWEPIFRRMTRGKKFEPLGIVDTHKPDGTCHACGADISRQGRT